MGAVTSLNSPVTAELPPPAGRSASLPARGCHVGRTRFLGRRTFLATHGGAARSVPKGQFPRGQRRAGGLSLRHGPPSCGLRRPAPRCLPPPLSKRKREARRDAEGGREGARGSAGGEGCARETVASASGRGCRLRWGKPRWGKAGRSQERGRVEKTHHILQEWVRICSFISGDFLCALN